MDILQMSFSASVMIVAVVMIRALTLHRLPKRTFIALWGVVICRLLIPFSIPYRFSFYTGLKLIKQMLSAQTATSVVSVPVGITGGTNIAELPTAGEVMPSVPAATAAVSPIFVAWLVGMCVFTLIFIIVYLKCRRDFKTSLPVQNDFAACWLREHALRRTVQIRQSDRIQAPLTYGVFRPVILLPKAIDWTDEAGLKVILVHELTHIRRFDALTKLVLAAAVCVHWFNPLVWVMYVLANRDIELSCDEAVVRSFGETMKSAYALTLISWEERKSSLAPLISGFSKNAIEERITAIMKIKKTSLIGVILALVLVIGTVTVFATNAAEENDSMTESDAQPWLGVSIKTDWPTRDMTYDRITFGSDRDWIVYRMGHEPDTEEALSDDLSVLTYHQLPVKYTSSESENAVELPGTAVDVTFYLDAASGVYRIDVYGDCEMTGRKTSDGTLSGVLTQYGGSNAVEQEGDNYILWYYNPSDSNQRMWFEVKDGELTKRMGIVDVSAAQSESAPVLTGEQAGLSVSNDEWVWPVEGCDTVTSMFGKRVHPVSGTTTESDHICISGDNADGAKVYAALAGTVLETGFKAEQGNYIIITHDNGIETSYRHLKEILVMDGDPVAAGDTIGTVGKTGDATGPCLAFCVNVSDVAVNPLDYYTTVPVGMSDTPPTASPESNTVTAEPTGNTTNKDTVSNPPIPASKNTDNAAENIAYDGYPVNQYGWTYGNISMREALGLDCDAYLMEAVGTKGQSGYIKTKDRESNKPSAPDEYRTVPLFDVDGYVIGAFVLSYSVSVENGTYLSATQEPAYPRNSKGETYGNNSMAQALGYKPDLVAALGTEGQSGYIREEDAPGADIVNTREDVPAYVVYMKTLPSVIMIPLYDQEGNVIGEFKTTNSYGEGNQPKHYDSLEEAREAVENGE